MLPELTNEKRIIFGGTVKALEDGRVAGYLIKFTDKDRRDLQGEYFTTKTDLHTESFPIAGKPMLYHHGLDDRIGVKALGNIAKTEIDDVGVWVETQLEMRDDYEKMIYELAKAGKLGWSSGALPQSVKIAEDGHIDSWAVIEGSLTPTPAMPFDTQIITIKALAERMPREASEMPREASEQQRDGANQQNENTRPQKENKPMTTKMTEEERKQGNPLETGEAGERRMDDDKMEDYTMSDVMRKLDELVEMLMDGKADMTTEDEKAARAAMEDEMKSIAGNDVKKAMEALENRLPDLTVKAVEAVIARRDKVKAAADSAWTKAAQAREGTSKSAGTRLGGSRIDSQTNLKYAHLEASDMALGLKMLAAGHGIRAGNVKRMIDNGIVSEEYVKEMAHKIYQYTNAQPYKSIKDNVALKSALPIKADELDASDIATQGQEWVAEWWSADVWRRERYDRIYDRVVAKGMMVQEIPQGYDTAHFPTEGSDPTAYTVPQANDLDTTDRPEVTAKINPFTTGEVQVTPGEIKLATSYTRILEEDAIVNLVQQVNRQINEKMLETRDQLMLNGDTATGASVNINLIDGTPAALSTLTAPYYLATNGFRKLPLVTNTSASRDAGSTLDINDYLSTLQLLDGELRQYRDRMMFIIDPDTEIATLNLESIKTYDVNPDYTIGVGLVPNLFGVQVMPSGFLPLANAAGKVSGTPGNNTKGTILLIYAPYWGFAYKRQITIDTAFDVLSGTTYYVASMRAGMVARGNNAAALSYNVNTTIT